MGKMRIFSSDESTVINDIIVKEVDKIVEHIKEVPIEVTKEVVIEKIVEVPVERIKEVVIEKIKEVPVERIKEVVVEKIVLDKELLIKESERLTKMIDKLEENIDVTSDVIGQELSHFKQLHENEIKSLKKQGLIALIFVLIIGLIF